MQIINNTIGLFENIHFQDDIIDKSIENHKELLKKIIPKCDKVLIASPFIMKDFKPFFRNIDIENIEFELITTANPQGDEQIIKLFQMQNFGKTIKKFTKKWPKINLINSLHSKIYLFYKSNSIILGIITSANFTNSGLSRNHETGVILSNSEILKNLELDIKDNIENIDLSESKVTEWCKIADKRKIEYKYEQQEDIDLGLLDTFEEDIAPILENVNIKSNDIEIFIDENKIFDFEKFISKQIINNSQIETIDLSNLNINIIPPNISKLTKLNNIDISNNSIVVLPDELFLLERIKILNIEENKLGNINSNIQKLQELEILKINGNISLHISPQIHKLKKLSTIIVDKNIINMNFEVFQELIENDIKILDKDNINLCEYIKTYSIKKVVTCTKCNKEKEKALFESTRLHKKTNYKTGVCRDCKKIVKNQKGKDLEPIIRARYLELKQKAIDNKKELNFIVEELIKKFKNDQTFKKLYLDYINSELEEGNTELKPNLYINKELDFNLSNISAVTTQKIREINKKEGNNKQSTPVLQFTKDGKFIKKYNNMQIAKNETGINTGLISTSCTEEKINEKYIWIKEELFSQERLDKIVQNSKEKDNSINIESIKEIYKNSRENDDTLKKWLIELRDNEISKEFVIDDKCILSDELIGEFLNFKPIDKNEFATKISFKLRDNIEPKQIKFINDIFEIIEMAME